MHCLDQVQHPHQAQKITFIGGVYFLFCYNSNNMTNHKSLPAVRVTSSLRNWSCNSQGCQIRNFLLFPGVRNPFSDLFPLDSFHLCWGNTFLSSSLCLISLLNIIDVPLFIEFLLKSCCTVPWNELFYRRLKDQSVK